MCQIYVVVSDEFKSYSLRTVYPSPLKTSILNGSDTSSVLNHGVFKLSVILIGTQGGCNILLHESVKNNHTPHHSVLGCK